MAGQLMILNPGPKRRRKSKAKKATKRRRRRPMTAKQLKYFGKRRGKKKAKRATVIIATKNPGSSKMAKRRRRRSSKVKIHRRRFRRNPDPVSFMSQALMPAVIGAAGAIGIDLAMNYIPLPQSMQTTGMQSIVKVALAFGLGAAISSVAGAKAGGEATAGALVVTTYNLAQTYMQQSGFGQGGGYGGGYGNYGGYGGGYGQGQRMNRYVAMRGYMGRPARPRLGAMPRIGVRRQLTRPVVPPGLNRMPRRSRGMGYIGPAKTLGRYVNNR